MNGFRDTHHVRQHSFRRCGTWALNAFTARWGSDGNLYKMLRGLKGFLGIPSRRPGVTALRTHLAGTHRSYCYRIHKPRELPLAQFIAGTRRLPPTHARVKTMRGSTHGARWLNLVASLGLHDLVSAAWRKPFRITPSRIWGHCLDALCALLSRASKSVQRDFHRPGTHENDEAVRPEGRCARSAASHPMYTFLNCWSAAHHTHFLGQFFSIVGFCAVASRVIVHMDKRNVFGGFLSLRRSFRWTSTIASCASSKVGLLKWFVFPMQPQANKALTRAVRAHVGSDEDSPPKQLLMSRGSYSFTEDDATSRVR